MRLILVFVLALGIWCLLRYPYSHVVTGLGARILSVLSGMPPEEIIRVHEGEFFLDTGLVQQPYVRLSVYPVHWNSILFLSLLFITPWRLWKTCWRYLVFATLVLVLSHVGYFTVTIFGRVAAEHQTVGLGFLSEGAIKALAITVQSYSLIIEKALPFLLFAPIVMAWRKPPEPRKKRSRKKRTREKAGRNDPCPCGSGKKYKHCCL